MSLELFPEVATVRRPLQPPTEPIYRCHRWGTNGALIADVARLGWLTNTPTLDATYGKGNFWTEWTPDDLTTNDINPERRADHQWDWTQPIPTTETWPQIVFDPPYRNQGGAPTSSDHTDITDRFGLTANTTPYQILDDMRRGIANLLPLLGRQGTFAMKCADWVNGGRLHRGRYQMEKALEANGLRVVDEFIFLNNGSSQDASKTQLTARSNCSNLLIARRGSV